MSESLQFYVAFYVYCIKVATSETNNRLMLLEIIIIYLGMNYICCPGDNGLNRKEVALLFKGEVTQSIQPSKDYSMLLFLLLLMVRNWL